MKIDQKVLDDMAEALDCVFTEVTVSEIEAAFKAYHNYQSITDQPHYAENMRVLRKARGYADKLATTLNELPDLRQAGVDPALFFKAVVFAMGVNAPPVTEVDPIRDFVVRLWCSFENAGLNPKRSSRDPDHSRGVDLAPVMSRAQEALWVACRATGSEKYAWNCETDKPNFAKYVVRTIAKMLEIRSSIEELEEDWPTIPAGA